MTSLIDPDHLALYVGGDEGLRREILTIYEEQLEHWRNTIEVLMDDTQWHHAAHTLKGASRGVGAWKMGDICEKAEELIGDIPEKEQQRGELLKILVACIDDVLAEIPISCGDSVVTH